ncbi:citrate:proton symporter [Qipengyuania sp. GH1]|uniref:CitMHS family transporter n=1 Tax=Qipengyuania aestuarii TaxID=2867241 RepID=UPI001C87F383|nr:citrate:proton symporter [Qipengyuania aestuarii]MBX7536665.1 citrate:proton symporter [Qipengyuania aestuarii]
MLTIAALATIITVMVLLILNKVTPVAALCAVPVVASLAVGFGPEEISGFFESGLERVAGVAIMFIFAILFFGVLQDAGLFRPMIDGIVRLTKGNVVLVVIGTALVGMLAHLDGAGATTFLLTIPALLPVYRRLNMSPLLMLLVLVTGAGIFNMLPWAGPLGRASAVTGLDVTELWRPLIVIQGLGAGALVLLAVGLGLRERRRVAAAAASGAAPDSSDLRSPLAESSVLDETLLRPGNMVPNAVLFFAVMVALIIGILPAGLIFMLGFSVALTLNYPNVKIQLERISAHAGPAMMLASVILAAGVFLGVLEGSGMLRAMADNLVAVMPEWLLPHLHILIGFFGLPLELVLSTDAYYFGLLPVVIEVMQPLGVPDQSIVYALMIGNIVGTFISPFSASLWLALGLSGISLGEHIKYSLMIMWGFSLVLFSFAWILGMF